MTNTSMIALITVSFCLHWNGGWCTKEQKSILTALHLLLAFFQQFKWIGMSNNEHLVLYVQLKQLPGWSISKSDGTGGVVHHKKSFA